MTARLPQSKTNGAHAPAHAAAVAGLDPAAPYSSRLSARSALFTELHQLLDGETKALTPAEYRCRVVDENRLSKPSKAAREKLWKELKARYRGSVLGFFWSFINPLLLLLVYSFVFSFVMPAAHDERIEPYALFMFCGILPWTWFASSLNESAGVLISGGNLIKKVLFPAEILPIVTVLANMVHFFFGLVILAGFLVWYQRPLNLGSHDAPLRPTPATPARSPTTRHNAQPTTFLAPRLSVPYPPHHA